MLGPSVSVSRPGESGDSVVCELSRLLGPVVSVVNGVDVGPGSVAAIHIEPTVVEPVHHLAVAISTRSRVRQGPRGLISSVWCSPLVIRARELVLLCTTNSRVTPSRAPGTARAPIGAAAQIGTVSKSLCGPVTWSKVVCLRQIRPCDTRFPGP